MDMICPEFATLGLIVDGEDVAPEIRAPRSVSWIGIRLQNRPLLRRSRSFR